jgi:nickel-dependent lactate racemase
VVSDNTRPVPYKGANGILEPIIEALKRSSVENIKIIVACGTHRAMTKSELLEMLGDCAFGGGIEVINHQATDESMLRLIGRTDRTHEVTVNRHYLDAELKIATGLVEPHFMTGFSGGRKAICPGICGQSVTYSLHSASILNEEGTKSLALEGNSCHEEALRIAKMAGADFIVNVTVDRNKRITGVFSGDMEKAHLAAVKHLRTFASAELNKLYDIVVTQAGDVGVNHYQCAKAAFEAARAAKHGGSIIVLAKLTDPDPLGSQNYKEMMRLLIRSGPSAFCQKLLSDDWTFVPDQWQAQMWAKVFARLGDFKKMYLCSPRLADLQDGAIPEINAAGEIKPPADKDEITYAAQIVQHTVEKLCAANPKASVLILPEGPYLVPNYDG